MTNEEILEAIGNLTVLELSELVKAAEEKFGVSAAAPVAVAAAAFTKAPVERVAQRIAATVHLIAGFENVFSIIRNSSFLQ